MTTGPDIADTFFQATAAPSMESSLESSLLSKLLQLSFSLAFFVLCFCSMCRRPARNQANPPDQSRSLKDRKEFLSQNLVVHRVVLGGTDSGTDDSTGSESEGNANRAADDRADVESQLSSSAEESNEHCGGKTSGAAKAMGLNPVKKSAAEQGGIGSTGCLKNEKKGDLVLSASMARRSEEEDDEHSIASAPVSCEEARATCAICIARYHVGDEICWSPNQSCEHVFHHECIRMWLEKHNDCPMCRAPYFPACNSNTTAQSQGQEIRPFDVESSIPAIGTVVTVGAMAMQSSLESPQSSPSHELGTGGNDGESAEGGLLSARMNSDTTGSTARGHNDDTVRIFGIPAAAFQHGLHSNSASDRDG